MTETPLPPVAELVPHAPPMLLLSRVVWASAESLCAEARVDAHGPFGDGLQVPAWIGIEYMAQAVAAWAGCKASRAGGGPKLGFLLGTRRYRAHCPGFEHAAVLQVQVRCELLGESGLGAFDCAIMDHERVLAEARLSVFEPPDAYAYLSEDPA